MKRLMRLLGLMSSAAHIRNDFDVQIVDLRFSSVDELCYLIKKEKPLAVGFQYVDW